ncbi:MAG TPA: cation-translocating P-type ATPase [Clostridia bacterium]|nr:cation-translocating P-type ATPase [Clostridia bacterium]
MGDGTGYRKKTDDCITWHVLTAQEAALSLGSDPENGLLYAEARGRLLRFGPNSIDDDGGPNPWRTMVAQFSDFMVLMLLGAALVAAAMGEVVDSLTIAAIVVLNAILGFVQEYKAERALEALSLLSAPQARVIREGRVEVIPSEGVVPGDILLLEAGDIVAADAILSSSQALEVDESTLTGESFPVQKSEAVRPAPDAPLGDRNNMVFMGTKVTRGRGRAIVVATGMDTQIGRIAGMIKSSDKESTPLEKRLEGLGRAIVAGCLAICAAVAVAGYLRGEEPLTMFFTGVSLAVAAIPEGLPAIVTVALALGVQRMSRNNAIVRKLPAVETLGSTTAICSDKTGTITKNQMSVKSVIACGQQLDLSKEENGESDSAIAGIRKAFPWLGLLVSAGVLCNNASTDRRQRLPRDGFGIMLEEAFPRGTTLRWNGRRHMRARNPRDRDGDPTEVALIQLAWRLGFDPNAIRNRSKRVSEIPFDAQRRLMSVVVREGRGFRVFTKGAPEAVLGRSSHLLVCRGDGLESEPMTEEERQYLENLASSMGKKALRVLGLAHKTLGPGESADDPRVEDGLCFIGFVGLLDPPRPEAKRAVETCRAAGIKTIMVTGDHLNTALAIAAETGIISSAPLVTGELSPVRPRFPKRGKEGIPPFLTGRDLDAMSDEELEEICDHVRVYARVSPEHKLRIVRALKRRNHIVAMTGDGVNDAPALEEADIGVAMGKSGSEVTKSASDMVLSDDNFATIVKAVQEGRSIYDNVRRFIRYLLACNVGEILVMFLSTLAGLPLPLLPVQILWVNLVTDGLPALALGVEPPDEGVMLRPPRPRGESLFADGIGWRILERGSLIGVSTLGVFAWRLNLTGDLADARTWAFATLVACQLWHVFDCRSTPGTGPLGKLKGSGYLIASVLSSWALLLSAIYLPFFSAYFKTKPIPAPGWGVIVFIGGLGTIGSVLRSSDPNPQKF